MDAVAAGASASPAAVLAVASAVLLLASVAVIVFRKKSEPSGKITSAAVQINASATNGHHLEQQEDKPVVRILYGTQTGTAERFSKQLSSELKKRYGDSTIIDIMDIENYKAEDRLAKEKLVLFLMATYGDGEPTDNAADFYNWLTSQADGDNEELLKVCCSQPSWAGAPPRHQPRTLQQALLPRLFVKCTSTEMTADIYISKCPTPGLHSRKYV